MGTPENKEQPKADWTKTVAMLQRLEKVNFFGSVEIKMEAGKPTYARVTEGIKL